MSVTIGYKFRQSRIEAALVLILIPKGLAYRLLEPGDEVTTVLFLLETGKGHLGTGDVLENGVND